MRHTIDAILTPLAITVIIDQKVKSVEESEFIRQGRGLLDFFEHDPLTDDELLDWFRQKAPELEDLLWEKGGNTLVLKTLAEFSEAAECEAIFDAMVTISVADREYVVAESRLIKSAASIYGFPRPPLKVDR